MCQKGVVAASIKITFPSIPVIKKKTKHHSNPFPISRSDPKTSKQQTRYDQQTNTHVILARESKGLKSKEILTEDKEISGVSMIMKDF